MEIKITLQNHCLETGVKRAYEKLIGAYFKHGRSPDERAALEKKIDALKTMIERVDFGRMRSRHPELNGEEKLSLQIQIPGNEKDFFLSYHGKTTPLAWKNT